jgi:NADPH2:quinone reductase
MSLPEQMRVIEISKPGGPEVLKESYRRLPSMSSQEVLIRVAAAGVNRPDVAQRAGFYDPPPGASDLPGLEVAGEVIDVGSKTDRFKAGDKVCTLVNGGGYAEYVAVAETQCLPVPAGLSLVEAAALPETCFTVWTNVFDRAGLKAGESLLIHGGSSGIGTTAIQMAKALGAKVYITAGNEDKCKACIELGADLAINYKQQDFVDVLLEHTAGKGVDVILDMVAGSYVDRNLKVAAMEARVMIIAILGGIKGEVNFANIMMKRLSLGGSTLRPQSAAAKANIATSLEKTIWPLVESGKIKPVIYKTFALAEAPKAHTLMESSQHIGKIVLQMT